MSGSYVRRGQSAAINLSLRDRASRAKVAAQGLGPKDGFSGYAPFSSSGTDRTRWGDYGAAVPVGSDVWIASEYIGQTCNLAAYLTPPIGRCGGTRTSLANWYTRISQVRV